MNRGMARPAIHCKWFLFDAYHSLIDSPGRDSIASGPGGATNVCSAALFASFAFRLRSGSLRLKLKACHPRRHYEHKDRDHHDHDD